jgi:putative phage-type endonuclease
MTTTDLKQGTAEWLEARRGLLTASGVASIMGDSPFASAAVYMRRLVTETIDGPVELDAPPLNWGKENEHNARRLYEFLHDVQVEETGLWTNTWDLIPVGASPDGLVGEEGLVELKCPYGIRNEEKPQFKSIFRMPHYMHQVQMQLRITDRKWCDFFQWTPHGHKYERVSREDKWFDEVIEPMKEFYAAYLVAVKSAELGGPEEKCGMSARWAAAADTS